MIRQHALAALANPPCPSAFDLRQAELNALPWHFLGKNQECLAMSQVTTRQFRGCARRLREHPMTDKRRLAYLRPLLSRGIVIAGLVGSVALLPVAWIQGSATRRRVSHLPPAKPHTTGLYQGLARRFGCLR
jgi:hypothetical protein